VTAMEQILTTQFVWAAVIVMLIIVGATILIIVVLRVARAMSEARERRLSEPITPLVYAVAMADDVELPSAIAAVEALNRNDRRRAETTALRVLLRVKGESRAALIQLLRAEGITARARKMSQARSWVTRARGIEILGLVGGSRAVDQISPFTSDPVAEVRVVAVRALGHCEDESAVPILVTMLRKPDAVSPTITSTALLAHAHQAHDRVLPLLYDDDPRVRRNAALLSGYLIAAGTVAALEKAVAIERDDLVRMALATSLSTVQSRSSVAVLATLCEARESSAMRRSAAIALATFPPQWTLEQRAILITDHDREVRRAVEATATAESTAERSTP
jgi:HEAT repeat protein